MDVRAPHAQDAATHTLDAHVTHVRPLSRKRIGEALGEWQAAEVAAAWRYPQCRGLCQAQLEDIYQETVLALLNRPFASEEHLRNALRVGLRNRALHFHRDERRRAQILAAHAAEAHREAARRSELREPHNAAIAHEDGLVVLEFASGLTSLEQTIYTLEGDGLRYRAIAPMIGVDTKEARKASRELKDKYSRFQLLHDTGRLCGYRARTISAMQSGEQTSEQLARAAFAHLNACAQCRLEHRTNSARLRRAFQERAAALLPLPALLGHRESVEGMWVRLRLAAHRLLSGGAPPGAGSVRERAIAVLAGGGASAKVAAGVATVAAIAGGTLTATVAHHPGRAARPHVRHAAAAQASPQPAARAAASPTAVTASVASTRPAGEPRRSVKSSHREPGGFAFLGVPAGARTPPADATAASAGGGSSGGEGERDEHRAESVRQAAVDATAQQHGGGPFTP